MYFANKGNPSYGGIARVGCSDGSLQTYSTSTNFTIGNKLKLEISDSGNTIYFCGSVFDSTYDNLCKWDTSTANFGCFQIGSLHEAISIYSNSDDWFYTVYDYNQIYYPTVINPINDSLIWINQIYSASLDSIIINGFSDYDGTNIHSAFTLSTSPVYSLLAIYEQSTGNVVNNLKDTNTGQDVQIGSLYVDSNSVTWLSFFHQSGSNYSELIKYDMTTDTFITYQQTGAKYFYQYVDASNSNYWHGVVSTVKTTGVLIENMDIVSLINVTISTTVGLANSSLNIINGNSSLSLSSSSWNTGTPNPESDLDFNVSEI